MSDLLAGGVEIDAATEDEQYDEEGNLVETPEGDVETPESGEWVAPTQDEWSKTQRQLKRANAQAAKFRKAAEDKPEGEAAEVDVEAAKEEARKEAETKYKSRIVNAEAKAQLAKMGLKGKPDRLLTLLNLSEVDIEEDDIFGLDDQLEAIKADFPDLFDARKIKGERRLSTDAADKQEVPVPVSSAERLANIMRGKG